MAQSGSTSLSDEGAATESKASSTESAPAGAAASELNAADRPWPATTAPAGTRPWGPEKNEERRRRRYVLMGLLALAAVAVIAALIFSGKNDADDVAAVDPDADRNATDTGTETETGTGTEIEAGTGTDGDPTSDGTEDTNTAPDTGTDADADADADSDTDNDTDTAPDTDADSDADALPETTADTEGDATPDEAADGAGEADPFAGFVLDLDPGDATDADVPESRAVVKNGQIILEGAVPTQQDADEIAALAAQLLGEDNVINNYVVDPRAGDPSLGNVRVDDTVLFETGGATIAPEFEPLLGQALALMSARPNVTMTIVGHTDSVGPEQSNLILSLQRAQAVVQWLVDRGVDPDRLTAEGRGETEPIASNDTESGRQDNRRIQVFIENLLS